MDEAAVDAEAAMGHRSTLTGPGTEFESGEADSWTRRRVRGGRVSRMSPQRGARCIDMRKAVSFGRSRQGQAYPRNLAVWCPGREGEG
ncbi:MAG: hypothetical protein AMXMBFR53_11630 [Gemmatimonadota bacterium]